MVRSRAATGEAERLGEAEQRGGGERAEHRGEAHAVCSVEVTTQCVTRKPSAMPSATTASKDKSEDPSTQKCSHCMLGDVDFFWFLSQMLHVDACIAERGCGAAALLKAIVSPDDYVFILSSVILTRSKCNFLQTEPIFNGLWQC